MPVAVLGQRLGQFFQLLGCDETFAVGDFFRAGDFQALAVLDGFDEIAGFDQALVGAGVKPGIAATHDFDVELATFEVEAVEVGNLQLAPRRGFEAGCEVCRKNTGR